MNARPFAFRGEFAAPTDSAFHRPIAGIRPAVLQLRQLLLDRQRADGSWCELTTGAGPIEAELLILLAFLERGDDPRIPRLTRALLDRQLPDGGWTSTPGGAADVDATAVACLALTLNTTNVNSQALCRGRSRLAGWGTAGGCSGLTRLLLALFGLVPHADDWRAIPAHTRLEEWALCVIDVYRPFRPMPREQALERLFRDELRLPGGAVLNPIRRWNARRAARELQRFFAEFGEAALNGPTSVLPALALGCLGVPNDSPVWEVVWRGFDERTRSINGRDWVTPFVSPLRDSAQALIALRTAGVAADAAPIVAGSERLWNRLLRGQARGDLAIADVALSLIALARTDHAFHSERQALVEHVVHSLLDEQAANGEWMAADLTGLVLEALAEFGLVKGEPAVDQAIVYLERSQSSDGTWPGTLGVDHLYGTSRVLVGLCAAQVDPNSALVRRAVEWLERVQHVGGGWGEAASAASADVGEPNATQTAWALHGLIAAGAVLCPAVEAGVGWLLANENADGTWPDDGWTGRDPRGPHHHPLHNLIHPVTALAQVERHFSNW